MEDRALKTRTKILIMVAAAIGYFWLQQRLGVPAAPSHPPTQTELQAAYQDFNQMYFRDRLPHDVVIDFAESSAMASTVKMADGRFHIAFNERYNQSIRQARETLLHEDCHIKTWRSLDEMTPEEILTNQHGRRWRSCMLQLDMQGAFRREIIDYYEEN